MVDRLKPGMTVADVESQLGRDYRADDFPLPDGKYPNVYNSGFIMRYKVIGTNLPLFIQFRDISKWGGPETIERWCILVPSKSQESPAQPSQHKAPDYTEGKIVCHEVE
jgi:hypothetical protein